MSRPRSTASNPISRCRRWLMGTSADRRTTAHCRLRMFAMIAGVLPDTVQDVYPPMTVGGIRVTLLMRHRVTATSVMQMGLGKPGGGPVG